jgi:transcription elongation factor GreA
MNNSASSIRLTTAGRERLRAELNSLRMQIRGLDLRLREELQHKDDLSSYSTSQELALLRYRADELEATLESERPTTATAHSDKVQIGSRVVVRDESGKEHSFVIVHPIEIDPEKGFISHESPIGSALFGCRPGESVNVPIPLGVRRLDLVSVA